MPTMCKSTFLLSFVCQTFVHASIPSKRKIFEIKEKITSTCPLIRTRIHVNRIGNEGRLLI